MAYEPRLWQATGEGWVLTWAPMEPYLSGTPAVVADVEVALARRPYVDVSPTGPSVPSTASDPLAVLVTLAAVAPSRYYVSATAPRPPRTPENTLA